MPYIPLRVFSAYTMLDGAIEPKKIGEHAAKLGFPAAAITDRNGLYAVMPFQDGCTKSGVQPIIGSFVGITRPSRGGEEQNDRGAAISDWIGLYAQNDMGYENLCRIVSRAHLGSEGLSNPQIDFEFLRAHHHGLIALTAGHEGGLTRLCAQGQLDDAAKYLDNLQEIFGDRLYIELCRRNHETEIAAEPHLIKFALDRNIALVATNPACYAEPSFHEAHDAMLCIAEGTYVSSDDRKKSCPQAWLKTDRQMMEIFADIPEAIKNTAIVAKRCTAAAPYRKPILPSIAGDRDAEDAQLRKDALEGLEARFVERNITDEAVKKAYYDRLEFELNVICNMGFPGYFLIVADFIKWAKNEDIPVGPGRGSGAGSLVAWVLTITGLDPLELGLLFERFLNPDRVSMPDFDIDFCETHRTKVILYVQQKYGVDQVAQIITFGKLKARAVLRDTGRVLQMSYGHVDRLCKLVPNHPTDPWDLQKALSGVAELREEYRRDQDVARLFDLALKLEGLPRHSSTHAAGVVIGDRPLAQLVPLYRDPRSDIPVTQFDMKFVEIAGLVKFDFLGLKTLSVLKKAVDLLKVRGINVDLETLVLDDEKVYELLQRGDTVGVFQLESEGMRRTLSAVKPTNFGDIIALVSLYRPGPMDNIPMFGRRKNGEEDIAYPHPLLEGILKETYGIFVYQEQVMQAAQILAGYSLGEADLLRRAMGKKIQAEMDVQRKRFVDGCAEKAINASQANSLFDLIDKFAGYGFNKSHAAAYALLAYQTGWLKTHYPYEFYAASMCFDMHQTDKLAIFADDMRRNKITCLGPCVNHSSASYIVEQNDDGLAVRYALAGLKNVGQKAMEQIVVERKNNGPFTDINDFANRVDSSQLNKRQVENLACAGAFDSIYADRAAIFSSAEMIISVAQTAQQERISGQGGLFAGEEENSGFAGNIIQQCTPWDISEKMQNEKHAFGFYFAAHPMEQYRAVAEAKGASSYALLCNSGPIAEGVKKNAKMAAMVEAVRWRESKRGNRFVVVEMSDQSGQFSASCFEEEMGKKLAEQAEKSACLLFSLELDMKAGEETPRFTIKSFQSLEILAKTVSTTLELYLSSDNNLSMLSTLLTRSGEGRGVVLAKMPAGQNKIATMLLGRNFKFDADILEEIKALEGVDTAEITANNKHLQIVS
ncbi:DNA polymerase III subunit alpha [Sphingorhabdus lutea]|uniref:DNA polymerase III subunit alpha n=1 Tax=Sphingorhabdus lutea TaxID=1913578 RepID=A0A1L3JEY0_9SPHN|nr:DNA polymerase III subunit alpha [Sphingorhabdus lutea]APG63686.1 DNA polymerase III subunit alpha [Sphingorhabdus lutea]